VTRAALLADQRLGAGLLWAVGDLLGLAAAVVVVAQWMAAEDRRQAREDRRLDAGLDA
jgi:putative copper resistance protein D